MDISTLRPGILVSLKTSTRGNVSYERYDLETGKRLEDGAQVARWETKRTIADPDEWELAAKARSKAAGLIRKVCVHSAFGLLCPEADKDDLDAAIRAARKVVEDFNSTAKLTRVDVFAMNGRVAADDVEAVKSINSEIRDLMEAMEEGIKNCDASVIRDAANKARNVGQMLTPAASERVATAIAIARQSAKEIVKAGEQASLEVDNRAIRKIREARTAFLDLDEAQEIAKPVGKGRAIDLTPSDSPKGLIDSAADSAKAMRKARARQVELD